MTDFWRLVFPSKIWSLATLCDTLITIRVSHWLLRLIWRFSESESQYESVFWICVWIIIHTLFGPYSNKLLQNVTNGECFTNLKKLLQSVTSIIKRDIIYNKCDGYNKIWQKVITKSDRYYKVWQLLQSET